MSGFKSIVARRQLAEILPAPLLEYQSPTASLIAIPASSLARNVIPALFVFAAVMITLSIVVPINIVVSGYGAVASDKNIEVIQPYETSIVKTIDVVAGQNVKKGDLLAELDPTFTQSDLGSLQAQYDAAQTSVERLQAEVADKPYIPSRVTNYTATSLQVYQQDEAQLKSTLQSYDTRIESLRSTLRGEQANLVSYQGQYTIASQVLAKRTELERLHVGSQLDLLSAQSQAEQLKGEVDATEQAVDGARQDLASMIDERDAYKQQFFGQQAQTLSSESATMDDAKSQLLKANLRRQLVEIRADKDGSVLTVATVAPGTVLQSGDQLLTIQPDSSKMIVQLNFPAEEAGDLRVGQKVAIKFQAFAYNIHGEAYGTLKTLSSGSFLPGQQTQNYQQGVSGGAASPTVSQTSLPSTQVVTGLFYTGTATIDRLEMRGVPKDFRPVPGMAVTADDITGKRNTLELLMQRVLPAFTEYGNTP